MMPRPFADTSLPPSQRVALTLGLTLALCVFIAAGLALAVPDMPSFRTDLLYSVSIGMGIAVCSLLIDHATPWPAPLRRWQVPLTLAVATPLGYSLGLAVARLLCDCASPVQEAVRTNGHPAGLVATALGSLAVGVMAWNHGRVQSEAAGRANAQRLAAEAELRALRAQLDPHMLFNTLAHLRVLVEEEQPAALNMIDRLIPYLRGTLEGARSETGTLQQEFERLGHYLELMSLRIGPRLEWRLQLPPELRAEKLPAMLLQPLVENALKHGVGVRPGRGTVRVVARREAQGLVIEVRNSGRLGAGASLGADIDSGISAGISAGIGVGGGVAIGVNAVGRAGTGYGLQHVRDRLAALHGRAARCTVAETAADEVCVTLHLPA